MEFVWWGSSELIDRLSRNEHVGRRLFWFGQHEFDQDWFRLRIGEAVQAAGPRYTPEVHIDLPIAKDMERFSRSDLLFDEVKSLAIGTREAHNGLASIRRQSEQTLPETELDDLSKATSAVLDALSHLDSSPNDAIPFADIAKAAEEAAAAGTRVSGQLWELQRQHRAQNQQQRTSVAGYREPFGDLLYYVQRLNSAFAEAARVCNRADRLANNQLLLLKGNGGTGKTHLLCDFAKRRIQARLPTVLLMGQRFLSDEDPWTQLLQQLDLRGASAEEFVGAVEAAAQASECRALVIIDALNEGNGRAIWSAHLSAFLARLEKSPWIGVVISVRSTYEEAVIPEDVRRRAISVTHHGFGDYEYDAVKTFCWHYCLEFPSVPVLQPEFTNPLFLKTLCEGLRESGERRIPKGFHGITETFDRYLSAINARLAKPESLDYDPKNSLVRQALERIAERLAESATRWLARSDAQNVVNGLLEGRDYSRSLYPAVVAEGILTENMNLRSERPNEVEEVVFITYERFADHVIAYHLLSTHMDANNPRAAFAKDGALAFLCESGNYVPYGLIEALCIQAPERTGKELVNLAPEFLDAPSIGSAFLESIIWRKLDAFSDDTVEVLNKLIESKAIREDPLDTLLSVTRPWSSLQRRLSRPETPPRFHARPGCAVEHLPAPRMGLSRPCRPSGRLGVQSVSR